MSRQRKPWASSVASATRAALGLEVRGVDAAVSYQDVFGSGADLFTGSRSRAGMTVSTETALEVSTVFACVRIISDSISTLPIQQLVEVNGVPSQTTIKAKWLEFTGGQLTKTQALGQIMTSLLTDGNAYIATSRSNAGEIESLSLLDPFKVTPKRLSDNSIVYDVAVSGGRVRTVGHHDLKHITGMTLPGALEGLSPISYARESIGLSRAATEFGAAFFGNGAVPGSTIEVPGGLSPTAAKVIKDSWESAHQGVGNSGRLAVLTEGAKYSKVTLSNDESQFLQTREFQVSDIARFYGVPLQLLAAEGPQFGDTTAEQNVAFVSNSLRPWLERIDEAFTDLLVSEGRIRQPGSFSRLNVNGLLRGNLTERSAVWTAMVVQGIMTINEVRREESLPPVEWGDTPISVQVQEAKDKSNAGPEGEALDEANRSAAAQVEVERIAEAALLIQKVYLGVDVVLTSEEARAMVSSLGVDLPGDLPESEEELPFNAPQEDDDDEV
jgi:HK97 family phage portal protein